MIANFKKRILILTLAATLPACATKSARVTSDLQTYDQQIQLLTTEFAKQPADPNNKTWVKEKLNHMFEVDQYMRNYWSTPHTNKYSTEEKNQFNKEFITRSNQIDRQNTNELKSLLKIYTWFKISTFGMQADNQAWLLVQHADQDSEFQKDVLSKLEKLWPLGETKPSNYAYLYDRVASSFNDTTKMKPQRYGTQGRCTGPGEWQPWPIEDEQQVDKRRKEMGLTTLAEYKELFKDICH